MGRVLGRTFETPDPGCLQREGLTYFVDDQMGGYRIQPAGGCPLFSGPLESYNCSPAGGGHFPLLWVSPF